MRHTKVTVSRKQHSLACIRLVSMQVSIMLRLLSHHRRLLISFTFPVNCRQVNGCDCGVFLCRFAYGMYQLRDREFTCAEAGLEEGGGPFRELITRSEAFKFDLDDFARFRTDVKTLIDRLTALFDQHMQVNSLFEEKAMQRGRSLASEEDFSYEFDPDYSVGSDTSPSHTGTDYNESVKWTIGDPEAWAACDSDIAFAKCLTRQSTASYLERAVAGLSQKMEAGLRPYLWTKTACNYFGYIPNEAPEVDRTNHPDQWMPEYQHQPQAVKLTRASKEDLPCVKRGFAMRKKRSCQ
jgi:hypothetical protein